LDAAGLPAVDVTGVTHNAAWVRPGYAFVAIRGARADGHAFMADAVARGAVAVLGEGLPAGATTPLPYVVVPGARAALADAAAELAGHPSRRLGVVGITGTDGKTTTSWLTRHLLRAGGLATGLLSTVGYELPDGELRHFPSHFTTPEAPQVQEVLAEMVAAGGQAAVVEASSHALALDRVRAVDWDVAVWTHLTREHLDFHGTVENYFADKRKLVERAPFAVLNADDPWVEQLRGVAPSEWTYSAEGSASADWRALDVAEGTRGLRFRVESPVGAFEAELPMIGRFNVANALAGMAAAARLGVGVDALVAGLASFRGVPGRMELVPADDVRVIVDFAHTPPALEKALGALRTSAHGQVWVVVGSAGGRRDPGKHAPMGEVATRLAEHAIFTEDDPSGTPLGQILDEMERGAREEGRVNFRRMEDRHEAIRFAVLGAAAGDTILLAGKGPEETMDRGEESVPWDEVGEARAAIAGRGRDLLSDRVPN
ncbi:MAG: UDP-N-acetylmuramoyl-L-alanyl-D-glutamate--2,6-diaminopimelate ligase, partial [Actinobacteria bacterium]|nr:UDP-N-acetylmuramoyl-L-alanyl-D-glutamate--2,6-diaminopimelate ligase [Actinomycetota bacterium]